MRRIRFSSFSRYTLVSQSKEIFLFAKKWLIWNTESQYFTVVKVRTDMFLIYNYKGKSSPATHQIYWNMRVQISLIFFFYLSIYLVGSGATGHNGAEIIIVGLLFFTFKFHWNIKLLFLRGHSNKSTQYMFSKVTLISHSILYNIQIKLTHNYTFMKDSTIECNFLP